MAFGTTVCGEEESNIEKNRYQSFATLRTTTHHIKVISNYSGNCVSLFVSRIDREETTNTV